MISEPEQRKRVGSRNIVLVETYSNTIKPQLRQREEGYILHVLHIQVEFLICDGTGKVAAPAVIPGILNTSDGALYAVSWSCSR